MNTKYSRLLTIIITFGIIATVIIIFIYYYYPQILFLPPHIPITTTAIHNFKVKEIYPTKQNGREWFINLENPTADGIFDPQSKLTQQPDGSWQIKGRGGSGKYEDQVRMNVNTPKGEQQWKNVEITGYTKVISAESSKDRLDWYARGARHSSGVPCEGTSLKGNIRVNGEVFWQKEIWHTGGYTNEKARAVATDNSLLDRWIGWKVVIYNINNDKAVKMESYIDDKNNNNWKKVTELIDKGGWYADTSDKVFYSANCGRPKDYIITNSGPIVTFRSDNMIWNFIDLSVREIQPSSLS
ncbi:MAG TPA: hypothetical protein VKA95_12150 [Nitrososphaeraceae archaeon]|nr:hypothetical protein [Nitrososphaeraceae archaeon]